MRYFEKNGSIYAFDDDQINDGLHLGLNEVSLDYVVEKNKPTPEQEKQAKISELKKLLSASDYKFSGDYDAKNTQSWNELKANRQLWRDEIRKLEA